MPPPNPAAVVVTMAVLGAVVNLSLHRIDEGHVGVYYRGGALLKGSANPGFHMMIPLLTTYRWVGRHTLSRKSFGRNRKRGLRNLQFRTKAESNRKKVFWLKEGNFGRNEGFRQK